MKVLSLDRAERSANVHEFRRYQGHLARIDDDLHASHVLSVSVPHSEVAVDAA
ncbi:hypothetical protein [Brevibacterium salitolerans]|uniref:hypothetical protein n=1 Tax=Brevibacterium salitolerans TaxID=1403566 RepID=UPI0031D3241E